MADEESGDGKAFNMLKSNGLSDMVQVTKFFIHIFFI